MLKDDPPPAAGAGSRAARDSDRGQAEYEPLDLDGLRDAPADLFAPAPSSGIGSRMLRGIPFDLGPDDPRRADRAYLGFGDGLTGGPTRITIGRPCRTVIVAHALVDSQVQANGPLGIPVADYAFELADGTVELVPIREMFEIGIVPQTAETARGPDWLVERIAAHPYLAVPDRYDSRTTRRSGMWEQAGRRMLEVEQGFSDGFKLWVWRVPSGAVVEAIEVRPHGPRFAIGGITLGHADEHPFVRTGREPVVIERLDGVADVASVELRVDRGVATFAWPAAPENVEGFLGAEVKGWGDPFPEQPGRAVAEVAAVPSATLEVTDGDRLIGSVRWGDVLREGAASDGGIRIEWVDRTRTWVHTTVVDEATGRPVPCRIHFRSPSGVAWQPHGHHAHVNSDLPSWHMDVGGDVRLGRTSYAVIDGRCQGWLPEGDVLVEVVRGFEYEPLRTQVQIAPGQRELRLGIARWSDVRRDGWVCGDTHVHFLSVDGGHTEARAEDLQIVNLLQAQWGHLFTNAEDFTGQPSIGSDGETLVFVGQENRQHVLGHMGLLGLRRPVMPWSSDGASEAEIGGTLETTLSRWADEGHAAGALVTMPHFAYPNGELPALIATGRIDALEMIWQGRYFHEEYYRYLNAGYRLPLVGGTDKMTSEVPVGIYRTYVRVGNDEPLSFDGWAAGVAGGRTYLSAGPLMRLRVEGADIGDTIRLPRAGGSVEVEAIAESAAPIHTLQIVVAGRVVAEAVADAGTRRLELRERIPIDGSTWIAARAGGPGYYESRRTLCSFERGVFAHTSPVYIACGDGEWTRTDPDTLQYMVTRIEGVMAYVQETAPTARVGGGGHPHGGADHEAWLTQPLEEALEAIRARQGGATPRAARRQ
jgi:hypothetical protein